MNKKLTLAITGTAFAFGSLGALATPAGAHPQHYIVTPQGNQITLPCEPDAVSMVDEHHHPRHTGLHKSPAELIRAITVGSYGVGTCESPLDSGPR